MSSSPSNKVLRLDPPPVTIEVTETDIPPGSPLVTIEVTETDIPPGPPPVTIEVTKTGIEYDQWQARNTGYLTSRAGHPPMNDRDASSVLHLMFYLVYTKDGRSLLLKHGAPDNRASLKVALQAKFPDLKDERLEIALDAHFAAGAYAAAYKNGDLVNMPRQQEIYRQRLIAMLGALYDDAMSRDFSFVW
jgi:hypothetical protein